MRVASKVLLGGQLLLLLLGLSCPVHGQSPAVNSSAASVSVYANYVNSWLYLSPFENETYEFTNVPSPLGREGAAYGDEGEEFLYLAGGAVNLPGRVSNGGGPQAFSDVWIMNVATDTFTQCSPGLPSTLYYGQGEWNEANEQLVVVGGLQNAAASAESYFTGVYLVNFPTPVSCGPAGYSVQTVSVTPAQPGRKFHSIEIIDGLLYVFGGLNAVTPLSQAQLFYRVQLSSGAATLLNTNSPYFPVGIIEPAILEDESAELLYFYSGLSGPAGLPGSVFPPAGLMYLYDFERDLWLAPIQAQLGSSSAQLLHYPQFAYSCHTHTLDDEHWFFVGGNDNSNNSLDTVVHFDMSTDSTSGVPTITVLYSELPEVGLEHCAMGLGLGGELFVFTGYSQGVDSGAGPYPAVIYEALLPFLSPTLVLDPYATMLPAEDATSEWELTGQPAPREGAAYGSDGSLVYFAGGALLTAESVLCYTDVWAMNAAADAFVSYSTTLPGPTYFGTSVFNSQKLWVWGGRTNTAGSGALNTYRPETLPAQS